MTEPKQNPRRHKKEGTKPLTVVDLGKFSEEVLLPGMGKMIGEVKEELKKGINDLKTEMRQGFRETNTSIRTLAGEIAEIKVQQEDQNHEARIKRLERKVGIPVAQ